MDKQQPNQVTDNEAEAVLDNMSETADPEKAVTDPTPEEDVLTCLTREMGVIREMLNRLAEERVASPEPAKPRSGRRELEDMEQFHALFPDTPAADIPDEVWTSVEEEGLPLAAAFALWTRREELRRQSAEVTNLKNAKGWGRADSSKHADDLSPAEVRAMSPAEVRRNYSRIVASMKHWK